MKSSPRCRSRDISGYHNSPIATGMTPTYNPISVKSAAKRPLGSGVSTATGISWSNVVPVDVITLMACASPSTHG